MNNPTALQHLAQAEPELLPDEVNTLDGAVFNPRITPWAARSGAVDLYVNFDRLNNQLSAALLVAYKRVLIWYCENKSIRTVNSLHHRFCEFVGHPGPAPLQAIELGMVAAYRVNAKHQGWDLIAPFLKRWHAQGYAGLTPDANAFLTKAKSLKRIKAARPVETLCPYYGPFSTIERDAFDAAYTRAFGEGALSEEEYVLLTLLRIFGARPSQFALLKVKDVVRERKAGGLFEYALKIPSVKKGIVSRKQFKVRLLTTDFGQFLYEYAAKIADQLTGKLDDTQDAPLFPAHQVLAKHSQEGYEFHRVGSTMSRDIASCEEKIRCVSERTGEQMNVTAVRFRRTLGTALAEEGHPATVIAEALDHASTQHVQCYIGLTNKLNGRINKAMAFHMAPIAQAFSGVLVDREAEDPTLPQVRDIRVAGTFEPVGNCGKFGFCKSSAPLACYTCVSFRPFKDAPHEALLDFLLAERERYMATSGHTLAATEDRTIVAVAEVVQRCAEERAHG